MAGIICKGRSHKMSALVRQIHQVCVVGAGPAGFYTAMNIRKKLRDVQIDIIEKLPVPFGLIRYGVAPDHPEVKNVINTFTKVANEPNVNFYGNINFGKDISLADLRNNYHLVVLTYGAEEDKLLGIENENHKDVVPARRFVGWYNGLPDDTDLQVDLSKENTAIFGQGNVAMDVARILLTPIDILKKTDITDHALQKLAESKVKNVYLIGRRGPLQAAFTIKELREQIKMDKCKTIWKPEDFKGIEEIVSQMQRPRKRLTELMLKSLKEQNSVSPSDKDVKYFHPVFCRSPLKFIHNENSNLAGVELACNRLAGDDLHNQWCEPTGEREILDCGVAFRSIGYRSIQLDRDIPFDNKKGLISNDLGRVRFPEDSDRFDWGLYVAGWLRTGPVGVIVNTMANSFQVAATVCSDVETKTKELNLDSSKQGIRGINIILKDKNVQVVDWSGWQKIDKYEKEAGKQRGKPREKVCCVQKMVEIAS